MAWIAERRRQSRFETVVLPHLDAGYALARWLTRNDADAADVVQEACLRAFRYFDSYREDDAKSWILKIVRRACYDWIERNRPAEMVPLEMDADPEGAVNSAPAALDANAPGASSSALNSSNQRESASRVRCWSRSRPSSIAYLARICSKGSNYCCAQGGCGFVLRSAARENPSATQPLCPPNRDVTLMITVSCACRYRRS